MCASWAQARLGGNSLTRNYLRVSWEQNGSRPTAWRSSAHPGLGEDAQEHGEIREEQEKCFHVTVSTTSSAMSRVLIRSATSLPFTPSSNIVRQKGQAEARTSGFTAMACSTRIWFIRRPSCSSIHTRPPPAAAAEALAPMQVHLHQLAPADGAEHPPRRIVHVVVAAEVARVVVRDPFLPLAADSEPPRTDQLVQQLGVVDDAEVAVEVRVLVADRVEAVGACRDDLLEAVALQGLDVPLGEGLEEVLVADAAGRLARALLLGAQDGEVHASCLEEPHDRAGDFPVPLVEGAVAPHPVEVLGLAHVGHQPDAQVPGPVSPGLPGELPGVAVIFEVLERRLQLLGEARLVQHQMPPHVHDLRHVLDEDRTGLHAG